MAVLKFFPPEILALQAELPHHPDLISLLERHPTEEFEIKFAEIATYCEVILDGEYDENDFIKLAKIFTSKLQQKRGLHAGFLIVSELPDQMQ